MIFPYPKRQGLIIANSNYPSRPNFRKLSLSDLKSREKASSRAAALGSGRELANVREASERLHFLCSGKVPKRLKIVFPNESAT